MKHEDLSTITAYEIETMYFTASKEIQRYKEYLEALEIFLDDNISYTQTVYQRGKGGVFEMYVGSVNVEDQVIERESHREFYLKRIAELQERQDLLELAMHDLTARERQVLNAYYYAGQTAQELGLTEEYCFQIRQNGIKKILKYIHQKNEEAKLKEERTAKGA